MATALAPALVVQALRLRSTARKLPEPVGPRQGIAGAADQPVCLRLLVVGDSVAQGTGVDDQLRALALPLATALADRLGGRVAWQLLAKNGYRTVDAAAALRSTPSLEPADLLLAVLGFNDMKALTPRKTWLQALDDLHAAAIARCGIRATWHTAMPPFRKITSLPQPLRWAMERQAAHLNRALLVHLATRSDRRLAADPPMPRPLRGGWMASDGFHLGPLGYQAWVTVLTDMLATDPLIIERAQSHQGNSVHA